MKEFKVGQRVRVKTWDELKQVKGYEQDDREYIGNTASPLKMALWGMSDECCGRTFIVEKITTDGETFCFNNKWVISPWMCELVEDVKSEDGCEVCSDISKMTLQKATICKTGGKTTYWQKSNFVARHCPNCGRKL